MIVYILITLFPRPLFQFQQIQALSKDFREIWSQGQQNDSSLEQTIFDPHQGRVSANCLILTKLGQTALIKKKKKRNIRKLKNAKILVNYIKTKQCQYSYLQAEAVLQYSSWNTTKTHSLFTVWSGNTDEKQDSTFVSLSAGSKFFEQVYF